MTALNHSAPLEEVSSTKVAAAGWWCLVGGAIGAIQAGIVLAWPHQVPKERFSFPFTATGHVIAQSSFFLQHLPLVAAAVALMSLPGVRSSKVARTALRVGAIGLGLLALMELVAMSAATTSVTSNLGSLISALYGPPVLLIAGGLTVSGVALLRTDFSRVTASILVALGAWVLVVMTPALASGSFVAGRVVIGGWMLIFVALGWSMTRLDRV